MAFARDVEITGWANVGDKPGGGYVGELRFMKSLVALDRLGCKYLNQFTTAR
jgi:hypothetical protein